jgi:hypothetical protein
LQTNKEIEMLQTPAHTEIPDNTVTQNDLDTWYKLKADLARIKASEMLLRTKIFKFFFPAPVEGTNTAPLAQDWVIKGTYKLTRDIDIGVFNAYKEQFKEHGINSDKMVKYTPSLVVAEYRMLTEEQMSLFDNALIIKPGSPSLEVVLPAKKKAKEEAV